MGETTTDTVLELRDARKHFQLGFFGNRRVEALKGVSLQVKRGQVFGFLGPNGSGKTTSIKMLTGLLFPTSGEARILGGSPRHAAARRDLGYLPENPSFPDHLTGRETLRFLGRLAGRSDAEVRQLEGEVLGQVKLSNAADIQVRRYSKGMVQRLGLAQALIHQPPLLILDEPMSGLDPIGRRDVKDLIAKLGRQGRTIFFSTHVIADVEELCDEVAILIDGTLVKSGRVTDLLASEQRETEVRAMDVPADFPVKATSEEGAHQVFRLADANQSRELVERLWSAGARVVSLQTRRHGLEALFLAEVAKRPAANKVVEDQ